eukprot:Pgem_evm1s6618
MRTTNTNRLSANIVEKISLTKSVSTDDNILADTSLITPRSRANDIKSRAKERSSVIFYDIEKVDIDSHPIENESDNTNLNSDINKNNINNNNNDKINNNNITTRRGRSQVILNKPKKSIISNINIINQHDTTNTLQRTRTSSTGSYGSLTKKLTETGAKLRKKSLRRKNVFGRTHSAHIPETFSLKPKLASKLSSNDSKIRSTSINDLADLKLKRLSFDDALYLTAMENKNKNNEEKDKKPQEPEQIVIKEK